MVFGGEPIKGPERFASALSLHPIPSIAVGEVAGTVLEKVGEGADLVCLFVTAAHAGALEDMSAAIQTILDPKVMIGCAAEGVIAEGAQVTGQPAVSLWAGDVGEVVPMHLEVVDAPGGGKAIGGWPIGLDYVPAGAVIFSDPYSFPVPALFQQLNHAGGFPRVVGAMAEAGAAPGTSRLILDGKVHAEGTVGALIRGVEPTLLQTAVAQGARGIGLPLLVTKATGNTIEELDGQPAYRALAALAQNELDGEDVGRAERGILVGKAIEPESTSTAFAVRSLLSADAWNGTLTIGEQVKVGDVIQFHLPDPNFARIELARAFALHDIEVADGDEPVDAVSQLMFVDGSRASGFFGEEESDATLVAPDTIGLPTAGVVGSATFGPSRGRNAVHGLSATAAFFTPS